MDKYGMMLFTEEEIKERWREYVSELYDDPTRPEAEDIEVEDNIGMKISEDEIRKVVNNMKEGKSPGIDALTTEHLKALDDSGVEKLTEMKKEGFIDDAEFKQMKKEILGK